MGFIAGDALDTLKRFQGREVSPEVQKLLGDMQSALARIEDNVKRGGEIVQGLLTYTRRGEEGFSAVELNKLLDSSIEMVSFKVKTKQLELVRDFNGKLPRIKGNFTQLQEVLFNIIDNANDAITQRKEELKEPNYHGRIEFEAHTVGLNKMELTIKDNGMGVKEENMRKIFTPFFTTKLSSKKGTGLGMYVIKQIIEENHKGKVEFTSVFKEGSTTKLLLPIYSADLNKS
jgi:signal transduction histidine kinase